MSKITAALANDVPKKIAVRGADVGQRAYQAMTAIMFDSQEPAEPEAAESPDDHQPEFLQHNGDRRSARNECDIAVDGVKRIMRIE